MNACAEKHDRVTAAVIIVTYGNYGGLGNTVRSVLEQRYPITEIILSDDGSGKPFPQEVLEQLKEVDCPVSIRQGQENLGTTAHLNLLAGQCTSDCLKFIGAGDAFSDPDALGALIDAVKQTGAVAVTSNAVIASPDLKCRYYTFPGSGRGAQLETSGMELFRILAKGNIVSAAGTVFHRDFFTQMGGFDERYRLLEDWPTWLRMAREGKKLAFLDRVTCLYALGGSSSKKGNAFYNDALRADMLRCYENEIFPVKDCLTNEEMQEMEYGYALLQRNGAWALWKRFGWIHGRHLIKRGIKWGVLNVKTWIGRILSV